MTLDPASGPNFSKMLRRLLALAILGLGPMRAAEPVTPYGDNPSAGHTAALNGIRLYYEIYGQGAPLVVLHGNGGSISALRHQIECFRTRRQVIAIDSRGHGRSEMGPGRLTYEQMADDIAALLAQLHTGPADVLGWSDGGIVALLLALHHPAVVRRIALSGANLSPAGLASGDLAGMTAELRDAREKLAAGDRSRPWAIVCQQLQLMVTQPQITPADLARVEAPALVLAGEHDVIPLAHTRSIAAGLPRARLHIFPGAGHGALQEVPEAFNAAVEQFFAASP
jgi:pimeloyl-ACP methyl ester carboxylesterase